MRDAGSIQAMRGVTICFNIPLVDAGRVAEPVPCRQGEDQATMDAQGLLEKLESDGIGHLQVVYHD